MQLRLASILTHIVTTATVAACGGSVANEVTGPGATGTSAPEGTTGPSTPRPPPPRQGNDGGRAPDSGTDAGCALPPVLLVGAESCQDVWLQPCGVPPGVDPNDGMTGDECNVVCGKTGTSSGKYWGCGMYLQDDLPGPSFQCYTCIAGRRPEGYVEPAGTTTAATVAGWLAHAADLERVSVYAFQRMSLELEHHGAPSDLKRDVARAEADEIRHTRVVGTLARREGAVLSVAPVPHGPVRPLVEIALENAVEGCVRETYGALVASWQAQHAGRADIRRAMAVIAVDETAHADLAWRVQAWSMERLAPAERARVADAMREAVRELAAAASARVGADLVAALGLPAAADARRLVEGLATHLWGWSQAA